MNQLKEKTVLCEKSDLLANAGVCALYGDEQIALFYLPDQQPQLYAINNWDPIGNANVLSRGIIGDIDGRLVVASPLYKQHFDLQSGECIEDGSIVTKTYRVALDNNQVVLL